MEDLFRQLLDSIGQKGDPSKASEAFAYLTSGYKGDLEEIAQDALQAVDTDGMVTIKDLPLLSLCEHHLVPFWGTVSIGYIPDKHIMGLGRITKIVELFSKRLQTQEQLTQQICDALESMLKPKGIGVVIQADHVCMKITSEPGTETRVVTSVLRGTIKDDATMREAFLHVSNSL